jgi:hypothetical protein
MPIFFHLAAALLASVTSTAAAPLKPLHLHVEQDGKVTIFRVVGLSHEASSVSYDLQVTDGRNRSDQRGLAHLQPGIQSTVATVRVASGAGLSAKLNVQTSAGAGYIEEFGDRPGER